MWPSRKITFSLTLAASGALAWHSISAQHRADVQGSIRSVRSSFLAFWVLGKAVLDYQIGLRGMDSTSDEYTQKRSEIHSRTANSLLDLSQSNRGIYLKFGQYLGNLEKVIPKQFTDVLKALQDTAPSVPYDSISTVIMQDLRQSPFISFEQEAFSAASLAQVHRATLPSGAKVAVKLQFPTLRLQTKWDLIVMNRIAQICNWLIKRTQYKQLNVMKLFNVWTSTIQEELDFTIEMKNGQKTAELFKEQGWVHVPKYYSQFTTKRIIVMEYIEGVKINDKDKIETQLGLDPKKVAAKLVKIMAQMIFKHGFVHCDAHPGNILVRRTPKGSSSKFQIVLLDHGMYKTLNKDFISNFANLWLSLLEADEKKMNKYAKQLNIANHIQYLPLIFMNRTKTSNKKIGDNFTEEERNYLKERGLRNFDDIAQMIQDLPPELMLVIRASNLVALHNLALGGTRRDRLIENGRQCARAIYGDWWGSQLKLVGRIWMLEHMRWLYRLLFA